MEKQEKKDRPYVLLQLPRLLQDVLTHDCEQCGDGWLLKSDSEFGEIIQSCISPSLKPASRTLTEDQIKLYLPVTDITKHTYTRYFLCIHREQENMIRMYIDATFRLRVGQWFFEGRRLGYREKDIINAIVSQYGWKSSSDSYEMIKKIDYRQRDKLVKEVRTNISEALINNAPKKRESKDRELPFE